MTNYYYLACQYMAETEIFDRHMITTIERIKDEQIVREFNDPLNKKIVKKDKRKKNLKVYENF